MWIPNRMVHNPTRVVMTLAGILASVQFIYIKKKSTVICKKKKKKKKKKAEN